jgi:hypothetical protein
MHDDCHDRTQHTLLHDDDDDFHCRTRDCSCTTVKTIMMIVHSQLALGFLHHLLLHHRSSFQEGTVSCQRQCLSTPTRRRFASCSIFCAL